ncbi:MAG: CofH family radical SAM protein [Bacteroidales bacterium]
MLNKIKNNIDAGIPLNADELMFLYNMDDMSVLAALSGNIREQINGKNVYYNRNFHLEPSNVCVHRCKFCSYRRNSEDEAGAWTMSLNQIKEYCREKYKPGMTEVHIVGSVNPNKDFTYYLDVIKLVRSLLPPIVKIKGYSAIEIADMCTKAGLSFNDGLIKLKEAGLDAIPGGGAEIFNKEIREIICPDKPNADVYLQLHKTAHQLGIHTNATMLFGHIEERRHRVEHMLMIRDLQDITGGFDAFIPLKYRVSNNELGKGKKEVDIIEVLKTFAISRLALNNIPHIKSYWPMLGKELCQLSLLFGADDIDGTINDSTKIYSMAGAEEKSPILLASELASLAEHAGFIAVERDSYYNIL